MTFADFVETAGAALGLLLAFCAVVGLAAKYVVLPWLEDRFAPLKAQLEETHHQVTTNGHANPAEPTLKDSVHTLQNEVRELKGETRKDLSDLRADLYVVGQVYDRHVDHAAGESRKLWKALDSLAETVREYHPHDGNPAEDERKHDEREQPAGPAGPAGD